MTTQTNMKKFIIDVDTGIDDAQAIMMALSKPEEVKVMAVTCVEGNTNMEQACKNSTRILELFGRMDVPIFKGCRQALYRPTPSRYGVHGADGMGDRPELHPKPPADLSHLSDEHAANAICRIVNENPGEIDLITLAPLTNIAVALKLDPQLGEKLRSFTAMGGNIHGRGNITPAAEFNFYMDPEAAKLVLRDLGAPVTLLSWETCYEAVMPWEWYERMVAIETEKARFQATMNEDMVKRRHEVWMAKHYFTCDPLAVAVAMDASVALETERKYCDVETQGEITAGQVVVDWRERTGKTPNVNIVTKVHIDKVMAMFEQMLRD